MRFDDFHLDAALARGVADLSFTEPTPIQAAALPPALAGRDLLAAAETGSGKTAAFALPLLQRLARTPRGGVRALVLTPTRELAAQVHDHLRALGRHTGLVSAVVFGGVPAGPQLRALRAGVDILVATPGRLLDHLASGAARLERVEVLVLDEADRMLDMGFLPDVRRILARVPTKRQTMLFSATLPPAIVGLARSLLSNPARIGVERVAVPPSRVTQTLFPVADGLKRALLLEVLRRDEAGRVLVFTRTKHRANRLALFLHAAGVTCDRIHGNRTQSQRESALAGFKSGRLRVLVATDIASRGIDVQDLPQVINFDVPGQPEDYIHRVGRTARASRSGHAVTLVSPEEEPAVTAIERAVGSRLSRQRLEGFDYGARAAERFEIPVAERLAAARAQRRRPRRDETGRTAGRQRPRSGEPGGARRGGTRGPRGERQNTPGTPVKA